MLAGLLAVLSGSLVGFSLGLIGGGGSILAVPLLLYVVGVPEPHVAIGTSALAVSANAFANLVAHARAGTVKWPCALAFAVAGILGAAAGSTLGKLADGQHLLFLFAVVMMVVGAAMLRRRHALSNPEVRIDPKIAVKLLGIGFLTGLVSGFFGIGGGFLIVPGLMLGSGMPILNAIGSSLVSVSAFGLTTAVNYALSGLVAWTTALEFIAGGVLGGFLGMKAAVRLSGRKQTLTIVFAGVIFAVALYMMARTGLAILAG
jgi:uncharacterized membrane protein YfcA